MISRLKRLVLTALLVMPAAVVSQQPEGLEPLPDAPPPPPDVVESGEVMEPEVTIIHRKDATVEEYRLNGRLYMMKVSPVVGPSYYLLDSDGDGVMETDMSEIYSDFTIPQWVLFSW